MLPTLQDLGIENLSVDERIALAQAIWDSLPALPPMTSAQRQELQRRIADHLANPADVVPWEQIKGGRGVDRPLDKM